MPETLASRARRMPMQRPGVGHGGAHRQCAVWRRVCGVAHRTATLSWRSQVRTCSSSTSTLTNLTEGKRFDSCSKTGLIILHGPHLRAVGGEGRSAFVARKGPAVALLMQSTLQYLIFVFQERGMCLGVAWLEGVQVFCARTAWPCHVAVKSTRTALR